MCMFEVFILYSSTIAVFLSLCYGMPRRRLSKIRTPRNIYIILIIPKPKETFMRMLFIYLIID